MISGEKIAAGIASIPTLPVSVSRLVALSSDENSSARDYEEALKPDPALTANLLKLANSPFFGVSRTITSVRQVVTLLGTKQLLDVALSAGFSAVLPDSLPGYRVPSSAFWTHSIAVAALTERIAARISCPGREESFTCGLLHDIGKLVTSIYLAQHIAELDKLVQGEDQNLVDAEREVLGVDHADVGFALAERWRLSPAVSEVIRSHHALPDADGATLADVVHVADCLAHSMGYGADMGELAREMDAGAMRRVGLRPAALESVVGGAASQVESLSGMYTKREGEG